MNSQVFVPVTDELIYNHPEQIEGPLIPYEAGMECHEWLSIELNPEDDSAIDEIVKRRAAQRRVKGISSVNSRKKASGKKSPNLSLVYGSAVQ